MKIDLRSFTGVVTLAAVVAIAWAQDENTDHISIPFSDPSRPGKLLAGLLNGGFRVVGGTGKEVVFEAHVRSEESPERDDPDDSEKRHKSAGLRRITNTSTGLSIEEDNNIMQMQ